jgi:hypothetical protein
MGMPPPPAGNLCGKWEVVEVSIMPDGSLEPGWQWVPDLVVTPPLADEAL